MGGLARCEIRTREAEMNATLLLDTCAAIWAVEDQLSAATVEVLTRQYKSGEPVFLSPITAWELGLLFSRGRLRAARSPLEYFRQMTSLPGVRLAAMPPELLLASSFLPGAPPSDPADRIMAATAVNMATRWSPATRLCSLTPKKAISARWRADGFSPSDARIMRHRAANPQKLTLSMVAAMQKWPSSSRQRAHTHGLWTRWELRSA